MDSLIHVHFHRSKAWRTHGCVHFRPAQTTLHYPVPHSPGSEAQISCFLFLLHASRWLQSAHLQRCDRRWKSGSSLRQALFHVQKPILPHPRPAQTPLEIHILVLPHNRHPLQFHRFRLPPWRRTGRHLHPADGQIRPRAD